MGGAQGSQPGEVTVGGELCPDQESRRSLPWELYPPTLWGGARLELGPQRQLGMEAGSSQSAPLCPNQNLLLRAQQRRPPGQV